GGGGVPGVVPRVRAGDADASDRHRLAQAGVFVGEAGRGVGQREHVTRDAIVGQRDRRGRGGVIDLVLARGRHGQGAGRDIRRRAGGGVGRVVAGIGAAQTDATHAHRLARAHVLIREGRAGVVGGEDIARDPVVRKGHRRGRGAVVDLVLARGG